MQMSDDYKKGLIEGMAMQPLCVEGGDPEEVLYIGGEAVEAISAFTEVVVASSANPASDRDDLIEKILAAISEAFGWTESDSKLYIPDTDLFFCIDNSSGINSYCGNSSYNLWITNQSSYSLEDCTLRYLKTEHACVFAAFSVENGYSRLVTFGLAAEGENGQWAFIRPYYILWSGSSNAYEMGQLADLIHAGDLPRTIIFPVYDMRKRTAFYNLYAVECTQTFISSEYLSTATIGKNKFAFWCYSGNAYAIKVV